MFSRWDALLATIVFAVALWANLGAVPSTEFHRDEARWIHRARFLEDLRQPTGAYWQESELVIGQPPLGSYLTGLGLVAQGQNLLTNGYYDFRHNLDWNRRHGNVPNEIDLAAARRTNSVVGALLAASVYLIARGLMNPVAGVAAAALLIPHPLSIYLSSLAGSDAIVSLMVAWAVLAAMLLAERPVWPLAIVLGALLGLGGAAKLTPMALSILLAGAGLILVVTGWRWRNASDRRDSDLGWRLLVQPAIAAAMFVLAYPYLWPDPLRRTITLLRFRASEMENQGEIWTELRVDGPLDALTRIGHWLGEVDSVTGNGIGALTGLFGSTWKPMPLDLILAVMGGVILIAMAVQRGLGSRWAMAALLLGGQVLLIVVGMRADFARYLLPVLVANAVCGGLVFGFAWDLVWTRFSHRRDARSGGREHEAETASLQGEPVTS